MPQRTVALGATVVLVLATVTAAAASHQDVILEPIPVSDVAVSLDLVADGFTTPLWAINAPGDNKRLFVVDQVGKIWAIEIHPGKPAQVPERSLFLDIGSDGLDLLVPLGAFGPGSFDERGLLGLAFDPDYRDNGLVYTYSSEPVNGPADFSTMPADEDANHQGVLREWQVPNPKRPNSVVDPNSSRVLLTIDEPQFNHNSGAVLFGPDGFLYVAVGDGGSADDQGVGHAPGGNGQDLSPGNLLGKIIRIDPHGSNSVNGSYGIPADNPFITTDAPDEIWAYGFRNAFRMSFDQRTGALFAADVGQNDIEEINVVVGGGNYGWPVKEGSFLFDMNGDERGFTTVDSPGVPAGMIDPIAQYDHDEGISVGGGFVYRGSEIKDLRGSYVFGDFSLGFFPGNGRLFHLDEQGEIAELLPDGAALGRYVMGFGQDRRGEVYVLTSANFAPVGTTGTVHRLTDG
ncbi:MAG: PQQ-dependent sugar dehydrogenase [Acidimicrobiia bacterium]|nr:PQQ-dependent sugar dehydrogenase [Acidimicrobiia bacterium]